MKEKTIARLIKKHDKMRKRGINLVASENVLSTKARKALAGDLGGRYHSEWYGGSGAAREIIELTETLACRLFKARHALVTPLSGNLCDLAAIFAFTGPGEKIAMLPFTAGGYPLGVRKFNRRKVLLPLKADGFEIDPGLAAGVIAAEGVGLLLLGASFLLFPLPVRELSGIMKGSQPAGVFVYDGSHVLGLIGCGAFQDPLKEGADVLIASTHKSFYGPQGGIILTNSDELAAPLRNLFDFDLETGLGLVDNPHVNRIAALGLAIEEMLQDQGYASRTVENAKALAAALEAAGVPVRFRERGYTESHQVLLDIDEKRARELCSQLERARIFADIGGRLGVAELTHIGMGPSEMKSVAGLVGEVYHGGAGAEVTKRVKDLRSSFDA